MSDLISGLLMSCPRDWVLVNLLYPLVPFITRHNASHLGEICSSSKLQVHWPADRQGPDAPIFIVVYLDRNAVECGSHPVKQLSTPPRDRPPRRSRPHRLHRAPPWDHHQRPNPPPARNPSSPKLKARPTSIGGNSSASVSEGYWHSSSASGCGGGEGRGGRRISSGRRSWRTRSRRR
jgi:hypothetical protein